MGRHLEWGEQRVSQNCHGTVFLERLLRPFNGKKTAIYEGNPDGLPDYPILQ